MILHSHVVIMDICISNVSLVAGAIGRKNTATRYIGCVEILSSEDISRIGWIEDIWVECNIRVTGGIFRIIE